jgi:spermidine synthase
VPQAERHAAGRSGIVVAVCVCLLFLVSGSVGLIYEVAWKHVFTTVFGSTTYAVSVVIAVFMAGLALGSFVLGKLADRARRHLLIFALLQTGIAISGLIVPHALEAVEALYRVVFQATGSPGILRAVQVLASAVILLPPTFLMGGTLPILSRFMAARRGLVGPSVGLLYGLNTLGAALGAFLTGFVLVKALGTLRTIYVAATINVALAVAFLALYVIWRNMATTAAAEVEPERQERALGVGRLRLLLIAVAVSGFVAFSYEVLWTRLLAFKLTGTVYAFSLMLTTFLLGLGLGGAAVGLLRKRRPSANYWRIFAYLECAVGVYGLGTILLFFAARHGYESFAKLVVTDFGYAALVMLVPTTLMGAAFPIACELCAGGVARTGRSVGSIYLANTIGGVTGALLTGFYLVWALGTQRAVTFTSSIMILSGSVLLVATPAARGTAKNWLRTLLPVPIVLALAFLVHGATPAHYIENYFLKNQGYLVEDPDADVTMLGFAEDTQGVAIATKAAKGDRIIAAGPLDVAGDGYVTRTTQKLQAHVPMLLHPDPRKACQVGFGSGETAGIFASYDLEQYDCVEISPAMVEVAAAHFADINRGVVEDFKRRDDINLIMMDATVYLRYADETYDIIANDATWPAHAGPTMLFTLDHFRNARARLNPGGIVTSWLPFDMPLEDLKTVLKTFNTVFPHVYLWAVTSRPNKHSLIVGSDRPLRIDAARFMERFNRFAKDDLEAVYLGDPALFLTCHLTKLEGAEADLTGVPLHTDDLPRLQYLFSRPEEYSRYREPTQLTQAFQFFAAHRDSILAHLTNLDALEDAEAFVSRINRLDRANTLFLKARLLEYKYPQESTKAFRQAAALAPRHPAVRFEAPGWLAMSQLSREQILEQDLERLQELAGQFFMHGFYEKALIGLEEWAKREPDSAVPISEIGLVYLNTDRPDLAAEYLRRAERMDPALPDVHFNLGSAYLSARQIPSAIAEFEAQLRLEPDSADSLERLGVAYDLAGNPDRAEALLGRAVEADPNLAAARHSLGIFLCRQGRFAEATPHLERLVMLRPRLASAHALLADAYGRTGRAADARRHLDQASKLSASAPPGQGG